MMRDFNLTNRTNTDRYINQTSDLTGLKSVILYYQVSFLSFTIFAALLGNLVVLVATYLDKRLHNASKYFVACLATSDLLVAMFSVTIRLHQYLQQDRPLTIEFCRFWIWVDIFGEAASITSLTVICVDRYYKMSRPFRYKANMSTHRARCTIAFIWMYSASLAALGLFSYEEGTGVGISSENMCINQNKNFYTLAAFLGFFVPVAILVVLCILIFRIVQVHKKKRRLDDRQGDSEVARIHQTQSHGSNSRGLRTLAMIVITFIICWGPFFILFLILHYNPRALAPMDKRGAMLLKNIFFGVLPYTNSFLNPIIYAFFDNTFKVAIRDMLLCRKPHRQASAIKLTSSGLTLRRSLRAQPACSPNYSKGERDSAIIWNAECPKII